MKAKNIQVQILPNIQAMMTGVWRIERERDGVTLTYSDGSTEKGQISTSKWSEIHQLPFSIISEVQSQRSVHKRA